MPRGGVVRAMVFESGYIVSQENRISVQRFIALFQEARFEGFEAVRARVSAVVDLA